MPNMVNKEVDMSDEPYSFDDVKEHQMVRYRGNVGWVSEIHYTDHNGRGPHLRITLPHLDTNDTRLLVKDAVNRYIKEGKAVWFDWDHHLRSWDAIDVQKATA